MQNAVIEKLDMINRGEICALNVSVKELEPSKTFSESDSSAVLKFIA